MLRIHKVKPIGTRKASAFVDSWRGFDRWGVSDVKLPVYPPSPRRKELRDARERAGLTMTEAARRAGISVMEWCGLERGSHVPEDWEAAFAVLTG